MSDFYHYYLHQPDLRHFCDSLWANFAPRDSLDLLARRCSRQLDFALAAELASWRQRGWLPEPDAGRDDWVGDLWQSPLFQALMAVLGFYPDLQADIRPHLREPVQDAQEFAGRRQQFLAEYESGRVARGESLYWQNVLGYQAPELYLHPFLPVEGNLQGCDLACGWGRIALGLRDYSRIRLVGCDLARPSLRRLRRLARQLGLEDCVQGKRCDIFQLPFPQDSLDFYLAFDIFEHLAIPSLVRLLYDLLERARLGAILYTEIPLQAYCPALSHLRNWDVAGVVEAFQGTSWAGKTWKLRQHFSAAPEHFSFEVVGA